MKETSPAPAVVWAALSLLGLWAFVRWFEDVNLYIPSNVEYAHPGSYGLPYEDVWLTAEDGARLHGWFLDAAEPTKGMVPLPAPLASAPLVLPPGPRPVAVIFHGNGGNISQRLDKARALRAMGLSVLLFDYRGYGQSPGRPRERGLYEDGEAAARWALARAGGDPRRLVFYGESLGCAVALETSLHVTPGALVLDSPFTSILDMARDVYPRLPAGLLVTQRYDNLGKVGALQTPLLVLHSPEDDVIPFALGRRLYEAAPEPKRFVATRGGHNEGFLDTPYWASSIRDFLAGALAR